MTIKKDDYIQGFEHTGYDKEKQDTRKTKGWVNTIAEQGGHTLYDIQADDHWNGARSTLLTTEIGDVVKLDPKPRP